MKKELLDFIKLLSLSDKKSLIGKALKTTEEVGELAKVILPFENASGTLHRFSDKEKIKDSVADVILCALSIGYHLEFSHEEIFEMMAEKSKKWKELQIKESKISFPIPYEIHITIERPNDLENFKYICNILKVKPIIIDLQKNNETVMLDVMTSSVHYGNNQSAYYYATEIANSLNVYGKYKVLRTKIETVPWHPAAPAKYGDKMPENCYFESHIKIITTNNRRKNLYDLANLLTCHLSKNPFKILDDNECILMLTYRTYEKDYEQLNEKLDSIKNILKQNNFNFEKIEVEFSIYDTKISHDYKWLN